MGRQFWFSILALILSAGRLAAQSSSSDQLQVSPPPIRRADPPSPTASAEELDRRADELRSEKAYLDALDYYRAAIQKNPTSASLHNKAGIAFLQMQRYKDAKREFERAIKIDAQYADAYNNLGVVLYEEKNYGKAIKRYEKAIAIRADAASYFSNLGAAYFSKKEFEKAMVAYRQALELDPDVLERTSRAGVSARLPSPEDRAHYAYVMAKLYARMGVTDRALEYLKRAVEEGYKGISDVYKDAEFTDLRKNPLFTELMAAKIQGIPE